MIVEQTFSKRAKIILKNEVDARVVGLLPEHSELLYREFGVKPDGYFFNPRYKLRLWDGYHRYFHKDGQTYVMLLDRIIPKVVKFGYKVEIEDRRTSPNYQPPAIDSTYFSHITNPKTNTPWEVRPYQVDAVNEVLANGNGIIVAGTGAGKTTMNAAIVHSYGKFGARSITIVPSTTLVFQTAKWFKFFGLDTGVYCGDEKDLAHQHIVSTWQALKNAAHIVADFQVMVIDECHGTRAKVLKDIVSAHGHQIAYRFGLTGTMPKDKSQALTVNLALGPVRYEVAARDLMDAGYLAQLQIEIHQLDDKLVLRDEIPDGEFPDYTLETDWLHRSDLRMNYMSQFIQESGRQHKGNVLCLVNNIQQGRRLAAAIPGSRFLYGKDKNKVRQEVYDMFQTHDNLIVIATVHIAGTGLDIDRIFNLIFVDAGKSFIRTIQSIGRGLRKSDDKESVVVTDMCSNLKYGRKHLKERTKFYDEARYPYKITKINYASTCNDSSSAFTHL